MRIITLLILLTSTGILTAQRVINSAFPVEGNIQLATGIEIPKINNGYTIWLPDEGDLKGLIVFTHPRRDTTSEDIIDYALRHQLAVLYAITDNKLEFFFADERMQEIENYIQEVVSLYNIPKDNLLYCGMSLEGTRALKLAIFGQSGQSVHKLRPKAIAICDAPLDMLRFHREMVRAKELAFNPIAANEGNWVSSYLEKELGGTPEDSLSAYINYSPYCYLAGGGPNLKHLRGIAIRAYTEPDVNWWIDTRRKDYYGMNAVDLAALVNELKIKGEEAVELIVTDDKGYRPDGSRHPHSWSIVDEKDLVDWFLSLL